MFITVFTPTYNRSHLLPRLFESLKAQTNRDFEWLIVDDGSTDSTEELVKSFHLLAESEGYQEENRFSIRYIKQPNGGKHRAINRGVKEAQGDLFFIVDSDDYLPHDALEKVSKYFNRIKDDTTIGGVCGLDVNPNGYTIGSGLPSDEIICSCLDVRIKHHVTGDMKEVFRTKVMREFPFPEFEGERFCPEALVWNRIAQKYNLLYFNKPIYIAEYQAGGITDGIVKARMNSPVATVTTYKELNSYDIPLKEKIKSAINYWRFRLCVPKGKKMPQLPWYWYWCQPIGFVMHLRDKR